MGGSDLPHTRRRDFLAALGGGVAALAAGGPSIGGPDGPAGHALALGHAVLRTGVVGTSEAALRRILTQKLGHDAVPLEAVRRAMRMAASDDFRLGRTVRVDGVLLSRTEAEALAHFALAHDAGGA